MFLKKYDPIVDVVAALQARGFILDFSVTCSQLYCVQEQCYLDAEEFEVLEMYRFLIGPTWVRTDVYVIESFCPALKGILLTSVGQRQRRAPSILNEKIRKFWV